MTRHCMGPRKLLHVAVETPGCSVPRVLLRVSTDSSSQWLSDILKCQFQGLCPCYLPAVEASIPVVTLSASSLDFRSNAFKSSMLTAASTFCMQLAYIASGGGGGGG